MKKGMIFGILSLLMASLLISQSLVDASKQEQERRAKLKGKNAKVVTNADLKANAKTPAVIVGAPETAEAQPQAEVQPAPAAGAAAGTEAQPEPAPAGAQAPLAYATSVYPDFFLVDNPDLALGPPDDRYAELSETGVLDLDIEVNNGPGNDLAIYARPPAKVIPDAEKDNQLAGEQNSMWWGAFRYAVLGLDPKGEWQEIGLGSGENPDSFDLGALKSTTRIRIMFKTYSNPYNSGAKPLSQASQTLTFGVDAVGTLH